MEQQFTMNQNSHPKRLRTDPILEAIFEVRYEATLPAAAVAGLLYGELRKTLPIFEQLPAASIPAQIAESDPSLAYVPRYRIRNEARFSVVVGQSVLGISCAQPYVGWSEFKPHIISVLREAEKMDFMKKIERCSIKYVNLLEAPTIKDQSAMINASLMLGDMDLGENLTQIRSEIRKDGFVNVVQLGTGAQATVEGSTQQPLGLLLDIDTILVAPKDFWGNLSELVESSHSTEKSLFFSFLSKSAISKYGPIYDGN